MVKMYGSRFCRQCGSLFEVADPRDRLCASCGQPAAESPPKTTTVLPVAAPAPVAVKQRPAERKHATVTPASRPPVAVTPRRDTRKRGPRPKNTATGRNSGPVTGQRTLPMLRALMAAPAGLTTPQLAEHASSATSWINALGSTRQLMLKQERLGRVRQAGTAEGNRTRDSVVWRITGDGERYVKEADASETPPHPAPAPAADWPHIYGKPGSPWGIGKRRPAIPFTGQAPACRAGDRVEARDIRGNWLPKVAMGGPRYDHEAAFEKTWLSVPVAIPAEWDRLGEQARFVNWPAEDVRVVTAEPAPDPPKRRQRERPVPRDRSGDPAVPHLTSNGYKNHGCRCGECAFAHQQDVALFRARRKVAAGKPLSKLEAEALAEAVADDEERMYFRAAPGGRVASAIIPRWVPGGLCGPVSPTDRALAAAGHGTGIALAWS